jgi:hypothetical protein
MHPNMMDITIESKITLKNSMRMLLKKDVAQNDGKNKIVK